MNEKPKSVCPVFFPYADINTALIEEADCRLLNEESSPTPEKLMSGRKQPFAVAEYHEGVFIVLQEDKSDFEQQMHDCVELGYSSAFITLCHNLREWGFQYARFDAEGLMTDQVGLPTTDEEKERAEYIRSLVDWSRGYKKMPGSSYRSEFIEIAGYMQAMMDNMLPDEEWPRITELLAEARKLA